MSLNFKEPALSDKEWVKEALSKAETINSESAFGTYYLWSYCYSIRICKYKNMLIKKIGHENTKYECPQGADSVEDFKEAMTAIINDAKETGCEKLILTNFLGTEVQKIGEIFPGKFEFVPIRDNFEYVYRVEDLALLRGKKYHGKRNHISKFSKTFDWEYKPMVPDNKDKYLDFFKKWFESKNSDEPFKKPCEYKAIKKALEDYESLGLSGVILEIDGETVACTIGEKINDKAFLVHFEKAFHEFGGAYSVINSEFCKTLLGEYELVNREEDLGIPGLRKAKLSYEPLILLPKYEAILNAC